MRHRLFLLGLITILLLMQALLRAAEQATPFSGGEFLGYISFWELRGAIPLGIFAAGLFLVTTAAAAFSIHGALRIGRCPARLQQHAAATAAASLWCGIPAMVTCLGSLPYIFPWLDTCATTGWQTRQLLVWTLHGCTILLITCHFATQTNRRRAAGFTLPASLLCILALGQMGFGQAFILLPCGIMSAAGILMLLSSTYRRWAIIPLLTSLGMVGALLWLTAGAIAAIPAAGAVYFAAILALACPLYIKISSHKA